MNTINWHTCFFLLYATIACGSALAVVLIPDDKHIVRMAMFFCATMLAVAALFFLAGANFLGVLQLLAYAGGVTVLMIFGVMLTARGPLASLKTSGGQWILAIIINGALLAILWQSAFGIRDWHRGSDRCDAIASTTTTIGLGFLGVRSDRLDQPNALLQRGMSGYLLPFEIISIHLVVVLIGAAYLARAKRPAHLTEEPEDRDRG